MNNSIQKIRERLLLLLGRAFMVVLFVILTIFLATLGFLLSSSRSPFQSSITESLTGYYLGRDSWDGVEKVFDLDYRLREAPVVLLNSEQRILLDRRTGSTLSPGEMYEIGRGDVSMDIDINGEQVGVLVIPSLPIYVRLRLAGGILSPIGFISLILALFATVVGILLMRRFVDPLADVIYAARSVADGKLDTRIQTKGPQDLLSLSESFNEMAASLERSDRERREMLADVAHELRTPLSVIRGRLEGIVDGIYPENGSQVSLALEHTYVLERLIDDLRLLTLVEARQLQFDKRQVDVDDVIERVTAVFSAEAQEKNISLSFSEKSGNLSVQVDPQRFEQVMSNLVGNALRYVHDGGRVWIAAKETTEGVCITVNDNGAGIPEADLHFIFDRFWRKDKSRSRSSGGTGLGLAISKQLIEAQGGIIEARNHPEGGLQVEVLFPLGN